jgi:hypothetical protein
MALGVVLLVSLALVFLAGLTFVRRRAAVFTAGVAIACSAIAAALTHDGFLVVCAGALPLLGLLVLRSVFETYGELGSARRKSRRPARRRERERASDDSQLAA